MKLSSSPPPGWARQLCRHLFLPLVFLASAGAASANTINVPADQPTIQAAITAAANGDTVLLADGTYTGAGNVDVDFSGKNITVTSQHGAASTIINCGGSSGTNHRGFYLHSGETNAVISGLTIENGYENGNGGAIENSYSTVAVTNCILTGNTVSNGEGGGIDNQGTITVTNCVFVNNTADYGGGGLNNHGTATITNCTFANNTATSGGGGLLNQRTATLTNDILYGDTGGEIENYGSTTATYCDIQGGYTGAHNINAAPLFVSASDLHLQTGSPCSPQVPPAAHREPTSPETIAPTRPQSALMMPPRRRRRFSLSPLRQARHPSSKARPRSSRRPEPTRTAERGMPAPKSPGPAATPRSRQSAAQDSPQRLPSERPPSPPRPAASRRSRRRSRSRPMSARSTFPRPAMTAMTARMRRPS